MNQQKRIIVYQKLKDKAIKKEFIAKDIKYFQDYIVITEISWREQIFKDYKNMIVDCDDFRDLN